MSQTSFPFDAHTTPADIVARLAVAPRPDHYDELRDGDGSLRAPWQQFFDLIGSGGFAELDRRAQMVARHIRDDGVTYNVYADSGGPPRPWSLDLLPMIITAQDWAHIERGVTQRARLLSTIMRDVYGPQRLLREGFLPPALVLGNPGYLRPMVGCQPIGDVYLHIVAFDLARGPDGNWWIVGQRTQAPSGLGYALQNRMIVSRMFPEAFRELHVQRMAVSFRRMLDMMYKLSPIEGGGTPRVVLLTPGPYNETYFEHAYLARYLGVPLVEGDDLTVREERVFLKTLYGLERVHGILRRLDDDFCDPLELRADSALGVPGLMQALRAKQVVVANSLGSGFLESPAIHGFLPAISRRLFDEELAVPSLATWWCGEPAAYAQVAPRLTDMVVKPTYPAQAQRQGWGAQIGNLLGDVARADLHERIEAAPDEFTLQDYLPLSNVASWRNGRLVPRAAMVRVFAIADGRGEWQALPGGLTRIAGLEQMVTMQRGGSSVDTWVLTDGPVEAFSMLRGARQSDALAALSEARRPVTSRAAENLFWMGRYAERAEFTAHLARTTLARLDEDAQASTSLTDALARLAELHGLTPPGVPMPSQSLPVFERTLVAALIDEEGAASVAFNLAALARTADQLRERLSSGHARLIADAVALYRASSVEAQRDGRVSDDEAIGLLEELELRLTAITGAQTDRMTRDDGWRLLTIGRQLERLMLLTSTLRELFEADVALSEDGFDLLLELFDSIITYRARHQRWQHPAPLLDLLVLDRANPRSLAFVVNALRAELAALPAPHGAELAGQLAAPTTWPPVAVLSVAGPQSNFDALIKLATRLEEAGASLSSMIGARIFSHAEAKFRSVYR